MTKKLNVKALKIVKSLLTAQIAKDEQRLLDIPLKKLKTAEIDCVHYLSQYKRYFQLAQADSKTAAKYCKLLGNPKNSDERNSDLMYYLDSTLANVENYYAKAMYYHGKYRFYKKLCWYAEMAA